MGLSWCLWWNLAESEFGGNLRVCVLTFNVLYKDFNKCCTFNATLNDDGTVNLITIQHKKDPCLSTLTGRTQVYLLL